MLQSEAPEDPLQCCQSLSLSQSVHGPVINMHISDTLEKGVVRISWISACEHPLIMYQDWPLLA